MDAGVQILTLEVVARSFCADNYKRHRLSLVLSKSQWCSIAIPTTLQQRAIW